MRITVFSSAFFAIASAFCKNVQWNSNALAVVSILSTLHHSTVDNQYPGKNLLNLLDKALVHCTAARQLTHFVTYGEATSLAGMGYIACLVGATMMYYIWYPKHDDWEKYHAAIHLVCAGGSVFFDMACPVR